MTVKAEYTEMFAYSLKTLTAAYKKHVRWLAKCDAVSAGLATEDSLSGMPSKSAKHKMYDECARMVRMSGLNVDNARTLDDIGALIERFKTV